MDVLCHFFILYQELKKKEAEALEKLTMKAIVVTGSKKVSIVEKKLRPLEHGEVLLKMHCCGVCHSDLHIKNQEVTLETEDAAPSGRTLGHEGIGEVRILGPGVTNLKVEDRVGVPWFHSGCGSCDYCTTGEETFCPEMKGASVHVDGAMAEWYIARADYSVKVPEGLDSGPASSITCAGVTVYKGLKVSGIRAGQWVAIYGLDGLGNLALQYAKNVFGAKVVALDVNEGQLEFAKELGADLVINPGKQNALKEIQEATEGLGVHASVVTATSLQAYDSAVEVLRPRGHLVAIGVPSGDLKINLQKLIMKGIRITGSVVGTRQDLAEAFKFAAEGKVVPKVELREMKEIKEIFEEMEQGKIRGRMVLNLRD